MAADACLDWGERRPQLGSALQVALPPWLRKSCVVPELDTPHPGGNRLERPGIAHPPRPCRSEGTSGFAQVCSPLGCHPGKCRKSSP